MYTIGDLRGLIPACREYAYFQTGTYPPKPLPVLEEVERWLRFQNQGPALPHIAERMGQMLEDVRAHVARSLGADNDEIALTENTTYGINIVANGIAWRPSDRVVLSSEEHPGNRIPWFNHVARDGIECAFFRASPEPTRVVQEVAALLDDRTRVLAVSHVSRYTGIRLPLDQLIALAHSRGVPVMVDGAQAYGPLPVDLHALGCDYYAFSGHKYILAPQGTGGLYVRREKLSSLQPLFVGSGSQSHLGATEGLTLLDSARRFEFGSRDLARYAGFGRALDLWDEIGWLTMQQYIADYAARLKERLFQIPGTVLDTPTNPDQCAGIVAFRVPGCETRALVDSLLERDRVLVASDGMPDPGVRVCVHAFNDDDDMERLLAGVRRAMARH